VSGQTEICKEKVRGQSRIKVLPFPSPLCVVPLHATTPPLYVLPAQHCSVFSFARLLPPQRSSSPRGGGGGGGCCHCSCSCTAVGVCSVAFPAEAACMQCCHGHFLSSPFPFPTPLSALRYSAPFSSGIANPAKPIFSNGPRPLSSLLALAAAVAGSPCWRRSKRLSHSQGVAGPESESRRPKLKLNRGP
jgi:hypothetical protein